MKSADRTEFFKRLQSVIPKPETELEYANPFELLISVILSAQATDVSVNKATGKLYPVAHTPQGILDLGEAGLKHYIRTIGLYNSKAENIIKTCRILLDKHGGDVPHDRKSLEALPGVGRKTANILIGNAFGRPAIGVDTHVKRLAGRLGFSEQTDPDRIEKDLCELVPKENWVRFCHLLQFHGRRICKARKPQCDSCPGADMCPKIGV